MVPNFCKPDTMEHSCQLTKTHKQMKYVKCRNWFHALELNTLSQMIESIHIEASLVISQFTRVLTWYPFECKFITVTYDVTKLSRWLRNNPYTYNSIENENEKKNQVTDSIIGLVTYWHDFQCHSWRKRKCVFVCKPDNRYHESATHSKQRNAF